MRDYAIVQLRRDPFARQTLVKKCVGVASCRNCGQSRRLWVYGTQPDSISGRTNWHTGSFCGLSCHDSYHD